MNDFVPSFEFTRKVYDKLWAIFDFYTEKKILHFFECMIWATKEKNRVVEIHLPPTNKMVTSGSITIHYPTKGEIITRYPSISEVALNLDSDQLLLLFKFYHFKTKEWVVIRSFQFSS